MAQYLVESLCHRLTSPILDGYRKRIMSQQTNRGENSSVPFTRCTESKGQINSNSSKWSLGRLIMVVRVRICLEVLDLTRLASHHIFLDVSGHVAPIHPWS